MGGHDSSIMVLSSCAQVTTSWLPRSIYVLLRKMIPSLPSSDQCLEYSSTSAGSAYATAVDCDVR
jgi:hypothetical protein